MSARVEPLKTPVFVSFDYDHDDDLRVMLLGQAKHRDTPFAFTDWSIKRATRAWQDEARKRIRRSAVVIVICGHHTKSAEGVAAEIQIARDEGIPFWLLRGRKAGSCQWPRGTTWLWHTMNEWTWANIETICRRKTTPWWKQLW